MLRDDWFNLHKNDASDDKEVAKKKRKNWWYYNKWFVLGGLVLAMLVFDFAHSVHQNKLNTPDFQIAYVGAPIPQGTLDALEEAFREIGPDLNGDGRVIVRVNSYSVFPKDENAVADPSLAYASQTKLVVDIQAGDSFLFLMENPEKFQHDLGVLSRTDGTLPLDTPDSELPVYLKWSDCPVLAGLELGSYSDALLGDSFSGDNQQVLQNLYVGHRNPNRKDPAYNESCEAFWQELIAGASN